MKVSTKSSKLVWNHNVRAIGPALLHQLQEVIYRFRICSTTKDHATFITLTLYYIRDLTASIFLILFLKQIIPKN